MFISLVLARFFLYLLRLVFAPICLCLLALCFFFSIYFYVYLSIHLFALAEVTKVPTIWTDEKQSQEEAEPGRNRTWRKSEGRR